MTAKPNHNELHLGDCLDVAGDWADECFDLVYLDPPFNSKRNYNTVFEAELKEQSKAFAQARAFVDVWKWSGDDAARLEALKNARKKPVSRAMRGLHEMHGDGSNMSYLLYMAERLHELHRVLKPAGSLYLHCDPTMSHSLKLILDCIFGESNFRNEIVWRIGWVSGYKTQKVGWIRNHDTILYCAKDRTGFTFNKEFIPYKEGYLRRDGKPPNGKGVPIEDTWNCSDKDVLDSIMIKSFSKEKLGYATQKPLALLERIVKASSNEGDLVLDPFCGCGTTVEAAHVLQRNWVGIDISHRALDMVKQRMKDPKIPINGYPRDMASARQLAESRGGRAKFEEWAVTRIPGFISNDVKVGDGGIDGEGVLTAAPDSGDFRRLCLAQIKSGKISASDLRAFSGILNAQNAAFGVFVAMSGKDYPSKTAQEEVAKCGQIQFGARTYNRLLLWSIEQFFEHGEPNMPPMISPDSGKPIQQEIPAG